MNNERLSFYVDKKIVYVNVERTSNKNMYLKIKGTDILLSAHKRVGLEEIKRFADEHIESFVKYMNLKKENALFSLVKNTIWIEGKQLKISVLTGFAKPSASVKANTFYANTKEGTNEEVEDVIKKYLAKLLLKKIEKFQPIIEKEMGIDKHTFSVRYKTSTWATNSLAQMNISYSSRLAHYKDEIIKYVIVHELAHYKEPNHSSSFWSIVEEFVPNYKALRNALKENKTPSN